jgi:hypothetical protein
MSLTYEQAIDDIQAIIDTAWSTTGHPLFYEGVKGERPTTQVPWASLFIRHLLGRQDTLGGATSSYLREGNISMEIYVPLGKGLRLGYQLAKVIADAFEGVASPGGVWFRNTRINEGGKEGSYEVIFVLIDFQYYEEK